MAKQLNSVSNTKGEESKEENSSLVRNEDQSTKPHGSVENRAGSEEQGVQQEESGEPVKTLGDTEGTTVPSVLHRGVGISQGGTGGSRTWVCLHLADLLISGQEAGGSQGGRI